MTETNEQLLARAHEHLRWGRPHEAQTICREVVATNPKDWRLQYLLARTAAALHERESVVEYLREAVTLNPASWQLRNELGVACIASGDVAGAAAGFREALRLNSYEPRVLVNLGNALKSQGQLEEATVLFERAVRLNPNFAGAFCSLGQVLEMQGHFSAAAVSSRQALALEPNSAQAQVNLGRALQGLGDVEAALACYQAALPKLPALAALNSAALLAMEGRATEAVASARVAVGSAPDDASIHSYLLYLLQNDPAADWQCVADDHANWANRHAEHLYPLDKQHANDRNPVRRLRIGYVSPDFRSHAVMAFLEPILLGHDPAAFEVFCYSHVHSPDSATERLRTSIGNWRNISQISDEDAARQIESDRIDILVDVCGHMRNNRLLIFARKPAPIQVSYFTYPGTTGLKTIDYRITDVWQDPEGSEAFYSETLVRLPTISWCYRPWAERTVAETPAIANGYVTFGSLNSPSKMNGRVVGVWARILKEVPQAKLLLRTAKPSEDPAYIIAEFERHGIDAGRLEFVGKQSLNDYLATFDRIDVALDPFPYNGHTTSCDALWSGVPLVAIAGNVAQSRIGLSILSAFGMTELLAADDDEYVRIAADLSQDTRRLAATRATLQQRMRFSPLMDWAARVSSLQDLYRAMVRKWCAA